MVAKQSRRSWIQSAGQESDCKTPLQRCNIVFWSSHWFHWGGHIRLPGDYGRSIGREEWLLPCWTPSEQEKYQHMATFSLTGLLLPVQYGSSPFGIHATHGENTAVGEMQWRKCILHTHPHGSWDKGVLLFYYWFPPMISHWKQLGGGGTERQLAIPNLKSNISKSSKSKLLVSCKDQSKYQWIVCLLFV